jgi:hypothetical protein
VAVADDCTEADAAGEVGWFEAGAEDGCVVVVEAGVVVLDVAVGDVEVVGVDVGVGEVVAL